jgi:hypothetical protein|tara:strand:+ start:7292 stop:7438 length:147 start_codon:yes stop_codon:yes gene_type:complete
MQKYNVKTNSKNLELVKERLKKFETSCMVLAASNLLLWGIIIVNYFLN